MMKKALTILRFIGVGLSILVAIVFSFVELRTLFAGDSSLMESPISAGFGYGFRGLYFLLMIANGVLLIVSLAKKEQSSLIELLYNAFLVGVGFMSTLFYDWYVSLVIILINVITFLIRVLYKGEKLVKEKEE